MVSNTLPTTTGLAQSFLSSEPAKEKEQLKAAIAKSQHLDQSQVSDDVEEDFEEGLGACLSLPGFIADFLKGVGDRLKTTVKDVRIDLTIKLDMSSTSPGSHGSSSENVTLRFSLAKVEVHEASFDHNFGSRGADDIQTVIAGSRRISVENIQGLLISDSSLFSFLAQFSGSPSPVVTQSSGFAKGSAKRSDPASAPKSSTSSLNGSKMLQSTIFDPSALDSEANRALGSGTISDDEISTVARPEQDFGKSRASVRTNESDYCLNSSGYEDFNTTSGSFLEEVEEQAPLPQERRLYPSAKSDTISSNTQVHRVERLSRTGMQRPGPTFAGAGISGIGTQYEAGTRLSTSASRSAPHRDRDVSPKKLEVQSKDSFGRSLGSSPASSSPSRSQLAPSREDLTQSNIWSHEEAESMYMSVMSRASSKSTKPVPGGWNEFDSDAEDNLPESSRDHIPDQPRVSSRPAPAERTHGVSDSMMTSDEPSFAEFVSPDSSPRKSAVSEVKSTNPEADTGPPAPEKEETSPSPSLKSRSPGSKSDPASQTTRSSQSLPRAPVVTKPFFSIDSIDIDIPQDVPDQPESFQRAPSMDACGSLQFRAPEAFSMHEGAASRSHLPARQSLDSKSSMNEDTQIVAKPLFITFGKVAIFSDMAFLRLAALTSEQLLTIQSTEHNPKLSPPSGKSRSEMQNLELRGTAFTLVLVEELKGYFDADSGALPGESPLPEVPEADVLLELKFQDVFASHKFETDVVWTECTVKKLTFGYANKPILSFDSSRRMRESFRDSLEPVGSDLAIEISQSSIHFTKRVEIMTLPIHINLDMARLDETFGWFGGLSTVLGLGNSVMSNATVMEPGPKPVATKPRKGVRFERVDSPSTPEQNPNKMKFTARIGGISFGLYGKHSSLRLEGSAVRFVSRAEGIGMQIDRLRFSGPVLRGSQGPPAIGLQVDDLRLEYLPVPKEEDLGRLLALLSPSRDREEPDDDILLDTLLRQRRQGGLVRVNVGDVVGSIVRLSELEHFASISEELTKLATVAKYLPEDDRPGILILTMINDLAVEVEVIDQMGMVTIGSKNAEIGFVTFPSLILLGIDSLSVKHQEQELMGEVIPQSAKDGINAKFEGQRSPMILARFVGEEMEPTLKLKLWNLRLEYHVTTIMTALGISETATGEIIVSNLASSFATLTGASSPKPSSQSSSGSNKKLDGQKPIRIDVSLRDSAFGLNPKGSTAKGLVVFYNSRLLAIPPRTDGSAFNINLEIKKMGLMIIDSTENLTSIDISANRSPLISSRAQPNVLRALSSMGFVPVSDIASAEIKVAIISSDDGGDPLVDVEAHDDLFVLETCADSTQTLLNIMNGLKPPSPHGQELKYRTEVVPVEDMLASFTGDAFEADARDEDDTDYAVGLEEEDMVEDDVPQNLEFVSSYYNPDPESTAEDVANSMLEGDLSSLASPPATREIGGKRFLDSFHERYEVAPGGESLHFDEDHFANDSAVGGTAHRWNSEENTYDVSNQSKLKGSPFRLRLRDVHVIWNLFDGYDWQHTRDAISEAVNDVENKVAERTAAMRDKRRSRDFEDEQESVIGDFLFNSIYIGIPANHDPRDLARQVNRNLDDLASEAESYATTTTASPSPSRQGMPKARRKRLRLQRSKYHKLTIELKGVSADVIVFPPDSGETQSSIDIRVQDLDIFDHVPTSTWKKFATYMHDAGQRESGTSMVHIEMLNVKPVPDLAASEIILKATVLPLRLHVDQDALDFLTRFFEFKDDTSPPSVVSKADIPFLQRVEVNSIQVKLDFKPKRVDYAGLRSGHTTEFMNFFILDGADMVLRHVIIYGISGFDKLGKTLNDIWMPDIKRNQLPGVLAGLAPVRSLVNVGSGVRDLVVVPMREYRKDGRVLRSIQKGAFAFAKTTTTELAKLGAKLAVGTQTVLQNAEDLLAPAGPTSLAAYDSPRPSSAAAVAGAAEDADDEEDRTKISPYADQPIGVVQGLRGAYRHLERDLVLARDAIVAIPGEVLESGSAGGAAKAVLRGAPTVVLRPALGVSKAVGQTLLGATNSLDRAERKRIEDVGFQFSFQVLSALFLSGKDRPVLQPSTNVEQKYKRR